MRLGITSSEKHRQKEWEEVLSHLLSERCPVSDGQTSDISRSNSLSHVSGGDSSDPMTLVAELGKRPSHEFFASTCLFERVPSYCQLLT